MPFPLLPPPSSAALFNLPTRQEPLGKCLQASEDLPLSLPIGWAGGGPNLVPTEGIFIHREKVSCHINISPHFQTSVPTSAFVFLMQP